MTDAELDKLLARLTPQELAELDGLLMEPQPFKDWLPQISPTYTWDWPHLRIVQDALQRVFDGTLKRLIITEPPRHGKTECGTIRFPVYWLQHRPTDRVILGAYNATLARKFSRKARRIARTRLALNEERTAVEDWETIEGGGVRAVGVGEGVTGQGGNLIVIDDPVKSREEAESETYRDKTWEWYTDDLYTRLEPNGALVITMTRWHEDDLVGRILASETAKDWEVIHLPALAGEDDPIGRAVGEALCPDRYTTKDLLSIKAVMGDYGFSALYQGHPTPRSGGMFPASGPVIVDAVPPNLRGIRWWDYAGTTDGGAYTAGTLMAFANGLVYVLDVQRFQKAALERDRLVRQTAETDRAFGHVSYWLEQEPGSAGKDAASHFVRLLAGFNAHAQPATGDKVTRAEDSGWAAQWQAGNVRLLRGDWNQAYIREHASFPSGKFKDQVDSSVGAFTKLARAPLMASPIESLTKASYWTGA